jgi:hypothetical protein
MQHAACFGATSDVSDLKVLRHYVIWRITDILKTLIAEREGYPPEIS